MARRFARAWIEGRLGRGVASEEVPASFLLSEQLPGAVRLSTIHSAKGLDAGHVLLFGGHELEGRGDEEARRLLYIGMTRAREELCVSYHGKSRLMEEVVSAVSSRAH